MSEQVATINPGPVTFAVPASPGFAPLADDTGPSIAFGITFEINGTEVPVSTDDILGMKARGIDLGLPGPVVIGTIADFTAWFKRQFDVDLPAPADFPPPLDRIFDKITRLVWTVNAAHVHIYGTDDPRPTAYTLTVTAAWAKGDEIVLIDRVLAIRGAVFGVTNERRTTPAAA